VTLSIHAVEGRTVNRAFYSDLNQALIPAFVSVSELKLKTFRDVVGDACGDGGRLFEVALELLALGGMSVAAEPARLKWVRL